MFMHTNGEYGTRKTPLNRNNVRRRRSGFGLYMLSFIIVAGIGIGGGIVWNSNAHTVTCSVHNTSSSYGYDYTDKRWKTLRRVYTNECDVLQVQDNLFTGYFNSASVFNQIQEGKTYKFTISGHRISLPLYSSFPNITKVEEVS